MKLALTPAQFHDTLEDHSSFPDIQYIYMDNFVHQQRCTLLSLILLNGRRHHHKMMIYKAVIYVLFVGMFFMTLAFIPGERIQSVAGTHNSKGQGIRFIESDWEKALQEAGKQHKLIFLDAYASWCGPCRSLKKFTFTDKEAGDFFNKNFISVAINVEKGAGPELSQQYGIDACPTLIIADGTGKMITYTKGYISPGQLIEFGNFGLSQYKN
jgi:thioredoxin 1